MNSVVGDRPRRPSWIDRTWANHWSAIAVGPIVRPEVDEIRSMLAEFMENDPTNPLNCVLSENGRRWCPIERSRRDQFLDRAVVSTERMSTVDLHPYIRKHAPEPNERSAYRILVGPDSLTCYWAHILGDVVSNSAFPVLLTLGDVDGLRYLKPDVGMTTAGRLLLGEFRSHHKKWWQHHRRGARPFPASAPASIPVPAQLSADAVGYRMHAAEFQRFQQWRKDNLPEAPTSALMAAATHHALARNGVTVSADGFYTVVDLRRYLPADHALRPGNLAKSVYIPANMADPNDIGQAIRLAVDSARAVPALAIGGLRAGLLPRSHRPHPAEIPGITLTFNLMMRNPGLDHVRWTDLSTARYTVMTYPTSPENLTVAACGANGGIEFAASFVPELVDKRALQNSLVDLGDITDLMSSVLASAGTVS
ncbi:hypothetical protein QN239_29715 [Mycolicibacterium sp. Y3]